MSVTLLLTYLNTFASISIATFWIVNVAIAQKMSNKSWSTDEENKKSTWLISFIGLWVPAYFCPKYVTSLKMKKKIKEIRNKVFLRQSVSSLVCYIPSLIACMVIVNIPIGFIYNPGIILDNFKFNVIFGVVFLEGLIACVLSGTPQCSDLFNLIFCKPKYSDTNDKHMLPSQYERTSRYNDISRTLSTKRKTKTQEESYKNQALSILWSCLVLVLTLMPIICSIPMILLTNEMNVKSYAYFNLAPNHTVAIEATLHSTEKLDSIRKNEKISGYTKWIPDLMKSSGSVVFPKSSLTTEIHIMTIESWEKRRKMNMEEDTDVVAVLLLDDNQYRPSSPLQQVMHIPNDDYSPILYLVRNEDKHMVTEYLQSPKRLDIVLSDELIPASSWQCDMGRSGCLQDQYGEGHVIGNQYRTDACIWGGKPCDGYDNIQSVENYCSGSETLVCPLDELGFEDFTAKFNDPVRYLRWSPILCERKLHMLETQCDRGIPGWTKYLEEESTIIGATGNAIESKSRRYCTTRDEATGDRECIFEERKLTFCCIIAKNGCPPCQERFRPS